MSLVTFAPTDAMQVTIRPRIYKVDIGKVGFTGPVGPQGNAGTSTTPSYTYATLPAGSAGDIARVTDLNRGIYRHNGTRWIRIEGPIVRAEEFGVVFSTAASPVDIKAALQAAIDSLATLPGTVLLPSPPSINSGGSGVGVWLHSTGPVIVRESQAIVSHTPISLNTPFSGVGTGFRAMAGWSGEAFIKDRGYDNDPTNDYWHGARIENVGFDGNGLAPCAIVVNQMGEESWIRGCNGRNFTEAVYKLVGAHASGGIEHSSGWESPYVVKLTNHPTLTTPGMPNGGHVRLWAVSGDNQSLGHVYFDGSHHINGVGIKSERTPYGFVCGAGDGTRSGGAAANLVHVGSTFNAPGEGTSIHKIEGATARPGITAVGLTHSSTFTNILEDAVTSTTVPRSDYSRVIGFWSHNVSEDHGSGGEFISSVPVKLRRPDTAAVTLALEYASSLFMILHGGIAGSAMEDQLGNLGKFQSGKFLSPFGFGTGNSAAATTLGTVTRKMEIFDAAGVSIGFIPIYGTIT